MSAHSHHTFQYGCKCGKEFSGEIKKVELLLRLHYKKCKCPKSIESSSVSEPIIIQLSRNNSSSSQKITGNPNHPYPIEHSALKSFMGSL
jgi:hypothetical protein